ncbi:MAG: MATE family efflux transporter, partial [Elusimicrobia bacterium]|nr:MATE family efflux transporter [Elusimicrobiota bacterium]
LGNLLNILLDWMLIYGRLGAPALGVRGSALASLASTGFMAAVVGLAALGRVRAAAWRFRGWHRHVFGELLRLGVPAGLQTLAEVCAFGFTTVLMGRLGPVPTSAHQIALNLASITFMVPLGASMAAAVRVGQGIGRGDRAGAARAGDAALLFGVGFMSLTALLFWSVPAGLARLYTGDPAIVALAVRLLAVAAVFQVFDGTQVVLTGALRGLGETRLPFLANVAGHWLVGLPVGVTLTFRLGLGPQGLWWGLLTGLACVAGMLSWAWRARSAPLRRAT